MNTLKQLTDAMEYKGEIEIIEALREYYADDAEYLEAIKNDDDISDKVQEWADGEIEIYTGKVYQWIADNYKSVSDYEGEAIELAGGENLTIEKIGQWCQYLQAQADANEALASARKAIENFDNTAI